MVNIVDYLIIINFHVNLVDSIIDYDCHLFIFVTNYLINLIYRLNLKFDFQL